MKDFEALKKVQDSINKRVEFLEKENSELKNINNVLTAEKVQWEGQKTMQEQIVAQHLCNNDNVIQSLQNEIISLKEKLKNDNN